MDSTTKNFKKVRSLMYSTVVPGAGQVYSKRAYTGLGFFGAEIIIGSLALLAHSNYQKSWGGFQETYKSYQIEDDLKINSTKARYNTVC